MKKGGGKSTTQDLKEQMKLLEQHIKDSSQKVKALKSSLATSPLSIAHRHVQASQGGRGLSSTLQVFSSPLDHLLDEHTRSFITERQEEIQLAQENHAKLVKRAETLRYEILSELERTVKHLESEQEAAEEALRRDYEERQNNLRESFAQRVQAEREKAENTYKMKVLELGQELNILNYSKALEHDTKLSTTRSGPSSSAGKVRNEPILLQDTIYAGGNTGSTLRTEGEYFQQRYKEAAQKIKDLRSSLDIARGTQSQKNMRPESQKERVYGSAQRNLAKEFKTYGESAQKKRVRIAEDERNYSTGKPRDYGSSSKRRLESYSSSSEDEDFYRNYKNFKDKYELKRRIKGAGSRNVSFLDKK